MLKLKTQRAKRTFEAEDINDCYADKAAVPYARSKSYFA
jgi:hypothetical protein